MYTTPAFQEQSALPAQARLVTQASTQTHPEMQRTVPGDNVQTITEQQASEVVVAPVSPELMMIGCLTPFILAFLLFSTHMAHRALKFNRWVKRLQQITTLERALEKTPDECS